MGIIHVCSCKNYGVIPVIFSRMVSENSSVNARFQQKFECHFSKMSCEHCNYPNAILRVHFENRSQYFSGITRSILFKFTGLLMRQESFLGKKILFSFHLQKTNEKWGQNFQKNFKHLLLAKKSLLTYCFDSSKTIMSHLF